MGLSSHPLNDVPWSWEGDEDFGPPILDVATAPQRKSHVQSNSRAPAGPSPAPKQPLKWNTRLADRATAAVSLEATYEVPPHLLFELLADPTQHDQIFDAILAADSELLEADGPRRKWRLDYTARWNFWRVSGVCENRLYMWTDSDAGTVTFKLREPGFLKRYEGTWTIAAAGGTPLSAFNTTAAAAAAAASAESGSTATALSPAASTCDLTSPSSSSFSSGAGSSTSGSQPGSPFSSRGSSGGGGGRGRGGSFSSFSASSFSSSTWSEMVASAAIYAGGGTGSGGSSGVKAAPLASVTAAASSLPLRISQGLSGAAASLARMQAALYGYGTSSTGTGASASSDSGSGSGGAGSTGLTALPGVVAAAGSYAGALASTVCGWFSTSTAPSHMPWSPPGSYLAPSPLRHSLSLGRGEEEEGVRGQQQQKRQPELQLPTSALITASTLTSPKLTPPYPLNQALKTQSKGQVADMLDGLVRAAAARLQAQPQ